MLGTEKAEEEEEPEKLQIAPSSAAPDQGVTNIWIFSDMNIHLYHTCMYCIFDTNIFKYLFCTFVILIQIYPDTNLSRHRF